VVSILLSISCSKFDGRCYSLKFSSRKHTIIGKNEKEKLKQKLNKRKKKTKKQAKKTLKIINGKYHILYSSVFIAKNGKKVWSFNDEARLKLYKLNNKEINLYIQKLSISNMKSSGLYQIEGMGISLFEKIEGSFFTILGIPLMPLLSFFKKKKINVWK
jgi:septum formation protein